MLVRAADQLAGIATLTAVQLGEQPGAGGIEGTNTAYVYGWTGIFGQGSGQVSDLVFKCARIAGDPIAGAADWLIRALLRHMLDILTHQTCKCRFERHANSMFWPHLGQW
ncbi:hypothetical protein [Devosia beringensis]|uniref:hypothetical protein n=1 Tax=Devosia beringensis TaxID=2657486 RepID=UPI00186B9139|nr:hypothetical protein [Devosia beringensis]